MLVRVYRLPNGDVAIVHPSSSMRNAGETDKQLLDKVCAKLPEQKAGYTYRDIERSELPDKIHRHKWRLEANGKIKIDNSVLSADEKIDIIQSQIDDEMSKPNFDANKVLLLQERLKKKDFR